jgi:hypothetical protein
MLALFGTSTSNFDDTILVPQSKPRNYGYTKLGEVIKATQLFEIEKRETG